MDTALKQLMEIAAARGSRYVKGEAAITSLPAKMAELGVLLLEMAKRLPELDSAKKREELIDLQQRLDDLRKAIFASKVKTKIVRH